MQTRARVRGQGFRCHRVGVIVLLCQLVLYSASDALAQAADSSRKAAPAAAAKSHARPTAPAAAAAIAERQSFEVSRSDIRRAIQGAQHLRLLSDGQSEAIDPNSPSITARAGDIVYGSTAAGVPVRTEHDSTSVWQLPWRFWRVSENGALEQRLRIDIEIDGVGLTYSKADDLFAGAIEVGVIDESKPSGSSQLPSPVTLAVLGSADSFDPSALSIQHTSLPFTRVRLVAREPGDSVAVRIRTDFDTGSYPIRIPVERPRIRLRATPSQINGFGLESADLLVLLGGPPSRDSVSVTLTASGGHLEEEQVWAHPGRAAKAVLWSRGLGNDSVTAETPDQHHDAVALAFLFPWLFLVAIVLGGAVGSFIRQGYQAIKDRWPPTRTFVREMIVGIAAGAFVAGLQAVGVNLLQYAPKNYGEAAVGLLAALAAIIGSEIIDLIKKRFGAANATT
jgi:hypothetical protein